MKTKAVILFSGGIDSTTLLYKMIVEKFDVHALSFYYGQRHEVELDHAKSIANSLSIPYKIVDITSIARIFTGSGLNEDKVELDGNCASPDMRKTVLPCKNSIMLNVAVGYAVNIKANVVAYAAHRGDHPLYPDCGEYFVNVFEVAMRFASDNKDLSIYAPFISMNKGDVIREGMKLDVPYQNTYSCHSGREKHCGNCGKCTERKEAFQAANVPDPMIYE